MYGIKLFGLDLYGCLEALDRLDAYVDRELSPVEVRKVEQHLKLCHACARKFRFETEMIAAMKSKAENILIPGQLEKFKAKLDAILESESKLSQTPE